MAEKNTKKKRKLNKNQKALNFLCIVMALVVIFVAVVCISVDKKNDALREKEAEASQNAQTTESNKAPDASGENGASETVAEINGTTLPETTQPVTAAVAQPGTMDNPTIITIDEESWYLTLVYSSYRIPDDYEPDLVYVCESGERLDRRVAEHYEEMYNAALKDGVNLTPCSGYRSYELQERNYNNKYLKR